MKYYAVAIGREQKITQNWSECSKLVKGYSGAKFKSFTNISEAEDYIEHINRIMYNKETNNYEVERKLVPCFTNTKSTHKNNRVEIYIASNQIQEKKADGSKDFNRIGKPSVTLDIITIATVISSRDKLPLTKDSTPILRKGDSRLNNYIKTNTITSKQEIIVNKQKLYLKTLTETLNVIYKQGLKNVLISTDSLYLVTVLTENVLSEAKIYGLEIENEEELKKLYATIMGFENIYMSYHTGKICPDKLNHCKSVAQMQNSKQVLK